MYHISPPDGADYFSLVFCAARAFVLLHSHFPSPLHRTALSNVAYAVPAGYIFIFLNDLFGDEAEPTGLAWHGCIESF